MPCVGEYPNESDLKKREGFANKKQPANGFNQRPQGPMLAGGVRGSSGCVPCCASVRPVVDENPDMICPRLEMTKHLLRNFIGLCVVMRMSLIVDGFKLS